MKRKGWIRVAARRRRPGTVVGTATARGVIDTTCSEEGVGARSQERRLSTDSSDPGASPLAGRVLQLGPVAEDLGEALGDGVHRGRNVPLTDQRRLPFWIK